MLKMTYTQRILYVRVSSVIQAMNEHGLDLPKIAPVIVIAGRDACQELVGSCDGAKVAVAGGVGVGYLASPDSDVRRHVIAASRALGWFEVYKLIRCAVDNVVGQTGRQ